MRLRESYRRTVNREAGLLQPMVQPLDTVRAAARLGLGAPRTPSPPSKSVAEHLTRRGSLLALELATADEPFAAVYPFDRLVQHQEPLGRRLSLEGDMNRQEVRCGFAL